MRRRTMAVLVVAPLLVAACGDDDDDSSGGGAGAIEVTISDAGCAPDPIEVTAGPVTFDVTNDGSASVTELEVLDSDDHVVGEVENVVPGDDKSFSVTLEPGTYTSYCPNGTDVERGTINVSPG